MAAQRFRVPCGAIRSTALACAFVACTACGGDDHGATDVDAAGVDAATSGCDRTQVFAPGLAWSEGVSRDFVINGRFVDLAAALP